MEFKEGLFWKIIKVCGILFDDVMILFGFLKYIF